MQLWQINQQFLSIFLRMLKMLIADTFALLLLIPERPKSDGRHEAIIEAAAGLLRYSKIIFRLAAIPPQKGAHTRLSGDQQTLLFSHKTVLAENALQYSIGDGRMHVDVCGGLPLKSIDIVKSI